MINLSDFQHIIPSSEVDQLNENRQLDLIQPLFELGYLNTTQPQAAQLKEGIARFRLEGTDAQLLNLLTTDLASSSALELDSLEMETLSQLLSLEGEFPMKRLPDKGSCTVFSRVVHFRLRLLGLFKGKVASPFEQQSLDALKQLCQFLQIADNLLLAARLAGNLPQLIKQCLQTRQLTKKVLVFHCLQPVLGTSVKEEIQEEAEEHADSEKAQLQLERSIDGSLNDISQQLLARDEVEQETMENPLTNRAARLQRTRLLMQKILDELDEVFQQSLKKEQDLKDRIAASTTKKEKRKLKRELRRTTRKRLAAVSERQKKLIHLQRRLIRLSEKLNGLHFRFKSKLKKSLDPTAWQSLRRTVFQQRKPAKLQAMADAPFNQFLIRLIHLHQWTNGYYVGRMDARFGKRTFDAIVKMTEDIKGLRLKFILTQLKQPNGYWVLNIHYLFKRFVQLLQKQAGSKDSTTELLEEYQTAIQTPLGQATAQKAFEQSQQERQAAFRKVGKIRRIYLGVKSIARSGLRIIKRLVWLIKKGVDRLLTVFKNVIQVVYKCLREGLRQYGVGIALIVISNYLPNLKTTTVAKLLKRFKLKNIFSRSTPRPDQTLSKKQQFAIHLAAKIIQWGIALASGSLTWPALLLKIAVIFRKMLKQWLSGRQAQLQLS